MVSPGYEPRQFGSGIYMPNPCAVREGTCKGPLLPVGCVALGWTLTSLTFHFLTDLLGDSKQEMHVSVLCRL